MRIGNPRSIHAARLKMLTLALEWLAGAMVSAEIAPLLKHQLSVFRIHLDPLALFEVAIQNR